jgi:NADH-quinone oxidoreductase subunit N
MGLLLWDALRKDKAPGPIANASVVLLAIAWVASLVLHRGVGGGLVQTSMEGAYVLDGLSLFFKRLFIGATFFVVWMAGRCESRDVDRRSEFYILPWFALCGMGLLSSVNNFILLFVALELVTVTFYVLVSFFRDRADSLEAGAKYLILGALSTGCLVYGLTFVFGATASLEFGRVAAALAQPPLAPWVTLGVLLVLVGVGFKIAAVPFHWWVPDVYQGAPTAVTAFLSVASKAAGFVVLVRLMTGPFSPVWEDWAGFLCLLSGASIVFGNFGALAQRDLKRIMGYSSISHAGFLLMGVAGGTQQGVHSLLFYLVAYAAASLLVFGVLAAVIDGQGGAGLTRFDGLSRRQPLLAWLMTLGMVSLAGIPPMAGFIAKWSVFTAAWQSGMHWLVAVAIIGAVASLFYYLAVVRHMFFAEPPEAKDAPAIAVDRGYVGALVFLALATLLLGVFPNIFIKVLSALVF